MKNKTDFFIGLALLAFCCVMGYQIHLIPEPAALDFFSAGSFPTGVTIALALLSWQGRSWARMKARPAGLKGNSPSKSD